ncbi:GAF domain-containing protein [Enterococcus wangshanyuanii]|uniref:Histidine kinase n=1 Tax=Enterococcus wangshanyuanii TaxID=2005703 RepID=A0ABQ1P0Y3_9ENTE|nr:GAF domain-containing protein [Enterococcus wangshanyuanii]GGC88809.1 histidine kinase [Enterococcus wangshanyuanii]
MIEPIQQKIDQIKEELHVDFAALALSTISDRTSIRVIRWKYVSGNMNQHYERIRLQVGKGIGGIVWRTGRSYQATNLQKKPEQLVELPITRMEKLETVLAYPVLNTGEVKGVLLVGYREVRDVSSELMTAAQDKANELEAYL